MPEERIVYLDYLRVFATFAVIIIHVSAQNFSNTDVFSYNWQAFNLWDSASRWAVPAFVMISGVLFLDRDTDVKRIYKKYILHMITAFTVWSMVYAVFLGAGATSSFLDRMARVY